MAEIQFQVRPRAIRKLLARFLLFNHGEQTVAGRSIVDGWILFESRACENTEIKKSLFFVTRERRALMESH